MATDPAEVSVLTQLGELGVAHEIIACDPELADTAQFCEAYGYAPEDSANTIVVVGKSTPPVYAACVVLATTRLDVNGVVRRRLGAKKASFASAEETIEQSEGMQIGGVTPFGLPGGMRIWVDSTVMDCDEIVVGGGSRACKILVAPSVFDVLPGAEIVDDLAR